MRTTVSFSPSPDTIYIIIFFMFKFDCFVHVELIYNIVNKAKHYISHNSFFALYLMFSYNLFLS